MNHIENVLTILDKIILKTFRERGKRQINRDRQSLLNDLKQRYQYLWHSTYPEDILSFEEEKGICSGELYQFFALVPGSLSYVIENKRIPKRQ